MAEKTAITDAYTEDSVWVMSQMVEPRLAGGRLRVVGCLALLSLAAGCGRGDAREAFARYAECSERMRTGDAVEVAPSCMAPARLAPLLAQEDAADILASTRAMGLTLLGVGGDTENGADSVDLEVVGRLGDEPVALRVTMLRTDQGWLIAGERMDVKVGALTAPAGSPQPDFVLKENGRAVLDSKTGVWRDAGAGGYPVLLVDPFFDGPELQIDNFHMGTPSQTTGGPKESDEYRADSKVIGVRYRTTDGPARVLGGRLNVDEVDDGRVSGVLTLTVESGAAGPIEEFEVELTFSHIPLGA